MFPSGLYKLLMIRLFVYNCSYQGPDSQQKLRVTTISRRWVDGAAGSEVCSGKIYLMFLSSY